MTAPLSSTCHIPHLLLIPAVTDSDVIYNSPPPQQWGVLAPKHIQLCGKPQTLFHEVSGSLFKKQAPFAHKGDERREQAVAGCGVKLQPAQVDSTALKVWDCAQLTHLAVAQAPAFGSLAQTEARS